MMGLQKYFILLIEIVFGLYLVSEHCA